MKPAEAAAVDPAQQAPLGHNQPPAETPTQEQIIRARLEQENIGLLARKEEILEAVGRAPEAVEDDDTAGKLSDFIKQISACIKNANAARVAAKEPYLQGGRSVDGFFKTVSDPLDKAKRAMESRLGTYLRKKADEERRRREEEARKAEEEARAQAAAMRDSEDLDAAVAAEQDAQKAAKEADAKAAEMSRTRGDYGAVASLRTTWDFEILDYDNIPIRLLQPHLPRSAVEQAIRSFIKAGGRDLAGVRIFENTSAVVR